MAASRHDMRDVELVEEDGAPGVDPPGLRTGRAARDDRVPSAPRAPRRRRTAGLVWVAVLGLVVGDVTADARARAGQAALDRVPGVVAPLDTAPTELWRSDPTLRPELAEAGGLVVGVMGAHGSADVVGLDPATGAVAWRTVVRERGPGDGGGGVRCVAPEAPVATGPRPGAGTGGSHPPAAPTVTCVVDRAVTRDARAPRVAAPQDRLLTLDARSGAILADRVVPRSTVLAALDADLVVGHVDADGYVHVVRTDPLGEQVRWSFVTPRPLPRSHLAWSTRIGVDGGAVVVDDADGWVLTGEGQVLHSWTAVGQRLEGAALVVGAGRYLVRPQLDHGAWRRSHVTDLRSGTSFAVAGRPLPAWPDDGSVEPVLVHAEGSGGVVAHDASGHRTWSVEGAVQGRALVVGGRLVRVGPTELTGIDGRTGRVLWTTPRVRSARTSLLTDGRLVMVTEQDRVDGVVLRAYGLDDGRLRWTADLADDIGALAAFGDRLFGWTGQQLVALGVPTT